MAKKNEVKVEVDSTKLVKKIKTRQDELNALLEEIKAKYPEDYLEHQKWQMLNGYPGIEAMEAAYTKAPEEVANLEEALDDLAEEGESEE